MKLTVLGNGSATPIVERRASASILDLGNESILIDCGEAIQYQMLKYRVKFGRLNYILITHLHGDHFLGLVALLNTLNNMGRTEPLILIGPHGLEEIISVQLKYSQAFFRYTIDFRKTHPHVSEEIFSNSKMRIVTIPLRHRIPCTGFLIEEQKASRKILADKLPEDFPIPYFKLLKEGKDVTDELSGKVYPNKEYTAEAPKPLRVAYCSDTIYDPEIVPYIRHVDLLYHEATFTKELAQRAAETFHSTAAQAASIANQAEVKQLVIGHFSSRYKDLVAFEIEAQAVFENTFLAEEGQTYLV